MPRSRCWRSTTYQYARDFSGLLSATFGVDSPLAATLAREGRCVLAFAQDGQRYTLPCTVAMLPPDDPRRKRDLVAQRTLQPVIATGRSRPRLRAPLAGRDRRSRFGRAALAAEGQITR